MGAHATALSAGAMRDIARLNGFFTGRRANKTNTARNAFRRRGDTVCTLRQPDSRALLNHTYLCPVDKNFTKLGTIDVNSPYPLGHLGAESYEALTIHYKLVLPNMWCPEPSNFLEFL